MQFICYITIYHAIPSERIKAKGIARKFDYAAIYWHIAGSHSPITLIAIRTGGEQAADSYLA